MGRPLRCVTDEDRFWASVYKSDGCWLWTGHVNGSGYGLIRWRGRQSLAHRISFELHRGPVPLGLFVLHRCDEPPCVNPDHLYVGTKADNARDMMERGRDFRPHMAGETNGTARLTNAQAAQIRRLRPRGRAAHAMAAELGVHVATIRRVVAGQTYR